MKKKHYFRTILLLGLVLAVLTADSRWHLSTEEIQIWDERIPEAFDGFRIVQLSDLHLMQFGEGNDRLLEAVVRAKPDVIALTGDIVDRETGWEEEIRRLARNLVKIAPTYYVSGNHEWASGAARPLFDLLREEGVTVLRNRGILLERGYGRLVLAGVDDKNGPWDMKTPAELAEAIHQEWPGLYTVLLAHRNTELAEYAAAGFDLVLCGHAHGGLIRLPFTDGLINTERQWLPSYTSGLYRMGEMQCVVSRGLGNSVPVPRLLNRPHIPVVILRHGAEKE